MEIKFDLARFRQELQAAFKELGEDELKALVYDGIKQAIEDRLREIINYEFSRDIRNVIKKSREEVATSKDLQYRDPREMLKDSIRKIARNLTAEAVHDSVR